jgi:hypothetical protein
MGAHVAVVGLALGEDGENAVLQPAIADGDAARIEDREDRRPAVGDLETIDDNVPAIFDDEEGEVFCGGLAWAILARRIATPFVIGQLAAADDPFGSGANGDRDLWCPFVLDRRCFVVAAGMDGDFIAWPRRRTSVLELGWRLDRVNCNGRPLQSPGSLRRPFGGGKRRRMVDDWKKGPVAGSAGRVGFE